MKRTPARERHPLAKAPAFQVSKGAPAARAVGRVPNPRRPRLVRDVGGPLGDLFEIFPDLPRPPRPVARTTKGAKPRRGK